MLAETGPASRPARLWADLPLRRKGLLVVAIPLVAFLISTIALISATRRGNEVREALDRESEKRFVARSLLISVVDAESGIRGYLLTGDGAFLERYEIGRLRVAVQLEDLAFAYDPKEGGRFEVLRALVRHRMEILGRLRGGLPAGREAEVLERGHRVSGELRDALDVLILDANREVSRIQAEDERSERVTWSVVGIGVPLGLLGGFLAMSLFTSGVVRRAQMLEGNAERLAGGEPLRQRPAGEDELGRVAAAIGEAEVLLRRRERERDRFFTLSFDLLFIADAEGRFLRLNPAWEETLGWPIHRLLHTPLPDLVHPEDRDRTGTELRGLADGGDAVQMESRFRHGDGSDRCLLWVARLDGETERVYGAARDITERKRQEQVLQEQALGDELTGLRNRRGFVTLAEQQVRIADRTGRPMAVMFVDVDGMKGINDALGHADGDRALVDAARVLQASLRDADIIARLGGDEFCACSSTARRRPGPRSWTGSTRGWRS